MYQLYCILKDWEKPPTPDEIVITAGKKKLDGNTEVKYIKKLESVSKNIKKAFEDQQAQAGVHENDPFMYSGLRKHHNVWQFWIICSVVLYSVEITLSITKRK
jgi:hypothetical protein